MSISKKVDSALLMNSDCYLRCKRLRGEAARLDIGKMEMVSPGVISASFGKVQSFGGSRNPGQLGKIQVRGAKRLGGQKVIDVVTIQTHMVCVQRAHVNVCQAIHGQFADPGSALM